MDTCHAGSLGKRFTEHCRMPSPTPPHHILSWKPDELDDIGITTRGEDSAFASQETDVFTQDSSHVVLAATSGLGQAFELPHSGGLFTNSLIEALTDPDNLQKLKKMTYRMLMEETNRRMESKWEEFCSSKNGPLRVTARPYPASSLNRFRQKAECTNTYEEQPLFHGLLSRKLADNDLRPLITVNYSDYTELPID
jgi:hypothetical protein